MYHSIGNCVFLFLEAVLTFEQQHIAKASEAIKQCLAVCNQYRKKNTISESIGKTFKRVSTATRFQVNHKTNIEVSFISTAQL